LRQYRSCAGGSGPGHPGQTRQQALEHFSAKHALGLDPRVDTGSPQKMRSLKQK
jgi:hypothetical protein